MIRCSGLVAIWSRCFIVSGSKNVFVVEPSTRKQQIELIQCRLYAIQRSCEKIEMKWTQVCFFSMAIVSNLNISNIQQRRVTHLRKKTIKTILLLFSKPQDPQAFWRFSAFKPALPFHLANSTRTSIKAIPAYPRSIAMRCHEFDPLWSRGCAHQQLTNVHSHSQALVLQRKLCGQKC